MMRRMMMRIDIRELYLVSVDWRKVWTAWFLVVTI
jgi:hypothetical protein